jgi:hypothetical protein
MGGVVVNVEIWLAIDFQNAKSLIGGALCYIFANNINTS